MNILNGDRVNRRLIVILTIMVVALTALGIWLTFSVLRPTPPRSVAMAIDPQGSFDAEVGKRYRELFARDGIDLRLVPSAGAVESIVRLRDPKSGVSIAIIPGGITNRKESPRLVSLGTLFYEPLWLFSHNQHIEILKRTSNSETSAFPLAPRAAPAISWHSSSSRALACSSRNPQHCFSLRRRILLRSS
jgi:hypothetical protein